MPDTYHLPKPTPVRRPPRETIPDQIVLDVIHHAGTRNLVVIADRLAQLAAEYAKELNERDES